MAVNVTSCCIYLARWSPRWVARVADGALLFRAKPCLHRIVTRSHLSMPALAFAVTPTDSLLAELVTRGADPAIQSAGAIVLADPLGNLVLVYHQHTGKQLIKDFKRLLKASKIG